MALEPSQRPSRFAAHQSVFVSEQANHIGFSREIADLAKSPGNGGPHGCLSISRHLSQRRDSSPIFLLTQDEGCRLAD